MRGRIDVFRVATLALLLVMILALTRSIELARWTQGLNVLAPVGVVGVIVGVLLASSKLETYKAHGLGLLAGLFMVFWQTGRVLSPEEVGEGSRTGVIWRRLREWAGVLLSGRNNQDELLFVFTMGAIVWFIAYNNAWFVLRYNWVWWAILPTGLVMLVNLGYSTAGNYSNTPFIVFVFASMLLMVLSHVMRRSRRWDQEGLGRPGSVPTKLLLLGGALSMVLMIVAWQGPSRRIAITARNAFQQASRPFASVQDRWENAFGFLYPGGGVARGRIGGGFTSFDDSFKLGGPLRLGTQTVFVATGEARQYWMSIASDTYLGDQWGISQTVKEAGGAAQVGGRSLPQRAEPEELPDGVTELEQEVQLYVPVNGSIFAADAPVALDRPGRWQLSPNVRQGRVSIRGRLTAGDEDPRLQELEGVRAMLREIGPEKIRSATADDLRARRSSPTPQPATGSRREKPFSASAQATFTAEAEEFSIRAARIQRELTELRRDGMEVEYEYNATLGGELAYRYLVPNQDDVLSLSAAGRLQRGDRYTVTSHVANPTDSDLNGAQGRYPDWVREQYLTLPDTVPNRVRREAERVVREAGARTAHEKAQAIERYVRGFKYREDMPSTTPGKDFVDEFLFVHKAGYCVYHASAMAVMLRAVDVPTRIARGFAPGRYDDKAGKIVVTESQAHMWPQVYHLGFGWVNYEPTPIREEVDRSPSEFPQVGGFSERFPYEEYINGRNAGRAGADSAGGFEGDEVRVLPAPVRFALSSLVALAVLAVLLYAFTLVRLRGLRGATRQYAKLTQLGTALRVSPAPTQTPGEYGLRLSGVLPSGRAPISTIANRYVEEIFGRRPVRDSELEGEWRQVASSAAKHAPGRLAESLGELRLSDRLKRLRRR